MSRTTAAFASTMALVLVAGLSACNGTGPDDTGQRPSASTGASVSSGFTNPVYPHNFPDPQVVHGSDGYLAIATNGNGMNVQVLTSSDMTNWEQGTDALPQVAPWSSSGKVWAPEIIKWTDDSYRLYYTTKAPDPQWQCISVATSDKPEGPFVDDSKEPLVCETKEGGSIDQSPFIDSTGKAWLYWKNDGNAIGVDTWIKAQQLGPDGKTLTGKATKLFQQDLPWEGHLVEGPAVVEVATEMHCHCGSGALVV